MGKRVKLRFLRARGKHREKYVFTPVVEGVDTGFTLMISDTLTEHHLQRLLEFLGHEVTFNYDLLEVEYGPGRN